MGLHRTTWLAIPIVGLVLAGTGLGWWGYGQYQERQALAGETENQYNSNFHALVDHMHHLQQEIGKSVITNDRETFQTRLRDIWRLSYAAQTEVGRLPFELMPMHNTQQFLAMVSEQTNQWMDTNANPTDKMVHQKLDGMYTQSGKIEDGLVKLQDQAFNNQLRWRLVNQSLKKQNRDNQVVDGFRKIDTSAKAFVESQDHPSSTRRGRTFAMAPQRDVTSAEAIMSVRKFLRLGNDVKLNVEKTKPGAYRPEYTVIGSVPLGELTADVSVDGGHVLSFDIHHTMGHGDFDYTEAESKATDWLKARGFPDVEAIQSHQYDGIGYFIMAPKRADGSLVVGQGMLVKVSLDNGSVIALDANNYYFYPVKQVPARNYTADQLRKKLSPTFEVGMERKVLVLDEHQKYQPAVAFYGTSNDETYCVYMNANTGKEISIEQLS